MSRYDTLNKSDHLNKVIIRVVPRIHRPLYSGIAFLFKGGFMISKEKLNNYAEKLMFRMNDEEYETLIEEFDIIERQMELIGKIDGIKNVKPMTFPYEIEHAKMREDEVTDLLSTKDALINTKNVDKLQVEVPKVVE